MTDIVTRFLDRLEGVKPTAPGRWMARCPAHADRTPSLGIKGGEDGRLLLHCFAGCNIGEITSSVGLEVSDLFPESLRSDRPRPGNRGAGVVYVVAGEGDANRLRELRRRGDPGLALPPSTDPSWFRWPVRGKDIKILGRLSEQDLLLARKNHR